MTDPEVKTIAADQVLPLRQKLLRPGVKPDKCVFEGDREKSSFHLGIYHNKRLLGIASFLKQNQPNFPTRQAYRLRGMAVETGSQGKGLGRKLFKHGIDILKPTDTQLLWFNAREKAVEFYKKQGFEVVGDKFTIAEAGPHYLMVGEV